MTKKNRRELPPGDICIRLGFDGGACRNNVEMIASGPDGDIVRLRRGSPVEVFLLAWRGSMRQGEKVWLLDHRGALIVTMTKET